MRDEDLEEKAYKRYVRNRQKRTANLTQKMLDSQDQRYRPLELWCGSTKKSVSI